MDKIIEEVIKERNRQDELWGVQNHSPYVWNCILQEEVGEVAKAAMDADNRFLTNKFDPELLKHYREELTQVAAVAIAAIESLDRQYNDSSKD